MSAPKEQIPQLLQELLAMEQNIETLSMIEAFLGQLTIKGVGDVKNLSRCLSWVEGMRQGTRSRAEQIKSELPKENMEIKMGPEQPSTEPQPAEPEPQPSDAITVGPLEAEKGSPVLGPA